MTRAYFLSPTLPAGSTEQQTASSSTTTRTLASEQTNEQIVPLWERHTSWPSLSLAADVEHAEPSTIKNSARPSLLLAPEAQHVPPVNSAHIPIAG